MAIFDDDERGRCDQTGEIVHNPHLQTRHYMSHLVLAAKQSFQVFLEFGNGVGFSKDFLSAGLVDILDLTFHRLRGDGKDRNPLQ